VAVLQFWGFGLRTNRHLPVAAQGRFVRQALQGFANYFGVPGNIGALSAARTQVCRAWFRALRRRSQKAVRLNWQKMQSVIRQWVPSMRIVHPHPNARLRV